MEKEIEINTSPVGCELGHTSFWVFIVEDLTVLFICRSIRLWDIVLDAIYLIAGSITFFKFWLWILTQDLCYEKNPELFLSWNRNSCCKQSHSLGCLCFPRRLWPTGESQRKAFCIGALSDSLMGLISLYSLIAPSSLYSLSPFCFFQTLHSTSMWPDPWSMALCWNGLIKPSRDRLYACLAWSCRSH